eukprot:gene21515-3287_t
MKRSILICLVCSSLVDIATTQRPPRSRSGGSTKGAGAAQPDVVVTAATMRDAYNVDNIDYDQPRRNFLRKGSSSGSAAAAGKQAVSLEPASVARIGSDGINLPLDADDVATPTDTYVAASTGNGRYKTRGGNKIDERRGGVGDEEDSIPKTILVGTLDGALHAVDLQSGTWKWNFTGKPLLHGTAPSNGGQFSR